MVENREYVGWNRVYVNGGLLSRARQIKKNVSICEHDMWSREKEKKENVLMMIVVLWQFYDV